MKMTMVNSDLKGLIKTALGDRTNHIVCSNTITGFTSNYKAKKINNNGCIAFFSVHPLESESSLSPTLYISKSIMLITMYYMGYQIRLWWRTLMTHVYGIYILYTIKYSIILPQSSCQSNYFYQFKCKAYFTAIIAGNGALYYVCRIYRTFIIHIYITNT